MYRSKAQSCRCAEQLHSNLTTASKAALLSGRHPSVTYGPRTLPSGDPSITRAARLVNPNTPTVGPSTCCTGSTVNPSGLQRKGNRLCRARERDECSSVFAMLAVIVGIRLGQDGSAAERLDRWSDGPKRKTMKNGSSVEVALPKRKPAQPGSMRLRESASTCLLTQPSRVDEWRCEQQMMGGP